MRGSGGYLYAIRRRTVVRSRLLIISPLSVVHGLSQRILSEQDVLHFQPLKLLVQTPVDFLELERSCQALVVC